MSDKDTSKTPDAGGQVEGDEGATGADDAAADDESGDDDDAGDNGGQVVFESQDAFDDWLEKRLARDRRAQRRKAKEKGAKGGKDDAKAGKDDAEPADNSAADATLAKAQRMAIEATALVAATDAGLSGKRARAAVRLADLDNVLDSDGNVDAEAVADAIDEAVEENDFLAGDSAPTAENAEREVKERVGGKTPKADKDKPAGSVTAEEFAGMGYFERVQLRKRDPQLYSQLTGRA